VIHHLGVTVDDALVSRATVGVGLALHLRTGSKLFSDVQLRRLQGCVVLALLVLGVFALSCRTELFVQMPQRDRIQDLPLAWSLRMIPFGPWCALLFPCLVLIPDRLWATCLNCRRFGVSKPRLQILRCNVHFEASTSRV